MLEKFEDLKAIRNEKGASKDQPTNPIEKVSKDLGL